MLNNGRNNKIKPLGFDTAALILTSGLSDEAAAGLTQMVRDVARQYHYNDSTALTRLRTRLNMAAKRRKTRAWAQEVLETLAAKGERLEGVLT